jgi:hypothetical protein
MAMAAGYKTGMILLMLRLAIIPLGAANDNYPSGAGNAALGNVGVMMSGFWSVSHNQAGLGFYNHLATGVHHENRFFVPEFNLHAIAVTIPVPTATLGASYTYFGYRLYNESKLGLGIGKAFHERFAAGIQLDYLHIHCSSENGKKSAIAVEAGMIAQPVNNLFIGLHIFNPAGAKYSAEPGEELIPVILRFGLGYYPAEWLFIGVETEKDLGIRKLVCRSGLEYHVTKIMYARTGIEMAGSVHHSLGLGFVFGGIRADISFMHYQFVGYTPFLSLSYEFR